MDYLNRIDTAFQHASRVTNNLDQTRIEVEHKAGGDIVTVVDRALNVALEEVLRQHGEGWLSEESPDSADRLSKSRVWIVDPLDGTKEFVSGRSEWSVSVGLLENGELVAGGIWNPTKRERFLGGRGL